MLLTCHLREAYRRRLKQRAIDPATDDLVRSAIVFAPHPDDETLGCGGIIAKKRQAGANVTVVFMTDGSGSHGSFMPPQELATIRRQEAFAACRALDVPGDNLVFLDFPDGSLRRHETAAVKQIGRLLRECRPKEVYFPFSADGPADHLATYHAVRRAIAAGEEPVIRNAYPVWFWRHWPWTRQPMRVDKDALSLLAGTLKAMCGIRLLGTFSHIVDISDQLEQKRSALAAHRSQMERFWGKTEWPILEDVSGGDFLACFLQPYEVFQRREPAGGKMV